jgi:hypothetical protein
MLGAHLYVGLEAAAAEDDGSTVNVCDALLNSGFSDGSSTNRRS